jgi:AAA domain, putative AbiEii toxin, Type IV TA system
MDGTGRDGTGRDGNVVLVQCTTNPGSQTLEVSKLNAVMLGSEQLSDATFETPGNVQTWGSNESGGLRGPNVRNNMGAFRPLTEYFDTWSAGIYHFRTLRPGAATYEHQINAAERLSPTGDNLPAVLNFLYHNRRQKFNELDRLLRQIVPGIGDLYLPVTGSMMRIMFGEGDAPTQQLNLKNLGTGVEQLLMTLAVGLMGDGPSGVIIEEPETNLHPGAQRALLALIREWSATRPFIITTHSPVLLDTSQRTEVVLVTRESGDSHVKSLGNEALEALDELGVRLSDVLSADRLLLLEGTTDEAIFKIWFPQYLTNPRVALIPAGGGDNARYARRLQAWLTEADRLGDRRVLYLRDRDELPKTEIEALEKGGFVKVPLRRELENYLLDESAIAKVIQKQKKAAEPAADEVLQAMRDVADSLKQTVVLKRVCKELRPIRLMDNDLQKELAKQNAGLAQLQSAVIARIASADVIKTQTASLWEEAEKAVASAWEDHWRVLAPGEEILKGLWTRFGTCGYTKTTGGTQIATAMSEAPAELQEILDHFITG